MSVRIGSNISSHQAQRRLGEATSSLARTYEKLSSGQRINRPSDDAAGIAVADTLRVKSRLYTTGIRNINDGISLLNLVGSALEEQKKVLLRLSELAEQAANGVYSGAQRDAMSEEYQQLVKEYGRIGETTSFNGVKLLQAGRGENPDQIAIQAGVDSQGTSSLLIPLIDSGPMSGKVAVYGDLDSSGYVDNVDRAFLEWARGGGDVFNDPLGEASGIGSFDSWSWVAGSSLFRTSIVDSSGRSRDIAYSLWDFEYMAGSGHLEIMPFEYLGNGSLTPINGAFDPTFTPSVESRFTKTVTFSDGATGVLSADFSGIDFANGDGGRIDYHLEEDPPYVIVHDTTSQTKPDCIDATGVESVVRARGALETVQNRLTKLSEAQGLYGALQSRLQSALGTLASSKENSLAAESRIRDADIAQEASHLTRLQILQQASTSVLAQANQAPELALILLN